jgi:integrase
MPKAISPKSSTALQPAGDRAAHYALSSKSDNTRRAYAGAWAEFTSWCQQRGAQALPADPATVVGYLVDLAEHGAKVSTIGVKQAAIGSAHRTAGQPDPTKAESVRMVVKGIRRRLGSPPQKKTGISIADLRAIVAVLPDTLAGKRNRALILTGFAGAFRRSELVALDVEDLRLNDELQITLRRSKTDQEGRGQVKTIPQVRTKELDAVLAMRTWLAAAQLKSGAVFRRIDRWDNLRAERLAPQAVAIILKAAAVDAGLEPSQFAGHSLRSGFITSAADADVPEWAIAEQTGHKSERVLRGYIQAAGRGAKRAVLGAINGHKPQEKDST